MAFSPFPHITTQQVARRIAKKEKTHIRYVVPGQQDLGDGLLEMIEQAVPDVHQAALANGSEGLQLGEVLGTLLLVHAAQADADGAGGDNDNAMPIFTQLVGGLDNQREVGEQRLVGLLVYNGGCS